MASKCFGAFGETTGMADVDSTKLIKTSEVENSNSAFRKGQLRDTFPAGTEALVPLSAGRHLAAQHSMQVLRPTGWKIARAVVRIRRRRT